MVMQLQDFQPNMLPSVGEFFADKTILITGASGFMGKVLVEKVLRCCPHVTKVYLLLRGKNKKSATERWNEIAKQVIFNRLRAERPEALDKIIVIEGDVKKKDLSLSDFDRKCLEDEVGIVFHSAASVRFNDFMTDAIYLNTRGSLEMIKLARKMKQLKCFIYVSTTYSNVHLDIPEIEETVYPAEYSYKTLIKLAESGNTESLALLTPKILKKHPNTYTFSKHLAEQIMEEYAKELPIVIVRPSVVVNTLHEPFEGWTDNLNGINGIIVGVSKGLIRVFLAKASCSLDYVAVDYAINCLIVSAWHKSVYQEKSRNTLSVYNCAYRNIRKATFNDIMNDGMLISLQSPHEDMLWYPSIMLTQNLTMYKILFYIYQLIPGFIVDSCLYFTGSEPILVKIYRKIYIASLALQMFTERPFVFLNKNLLSLYTCLKEDDQKTFYMIPPEDLTINKIITIAHEGLKKFMFKTEKDPAQCMKQLNRLYWLDRTIHYTVFCILLWSTYKLTTMLSHIYLSDYFLED